jgi:hypothetical protein
MPVVRQVENLTFTFPDGWEAEKFDDGNFYRKHFSRQMNGIKAVDLLAKGPDGVAYFIEVKDYRHPDTTRPTALADVIAQKVLMSLAALLPSKHRASDPAEQGLAARILECDDFRVIAHLELPQAHKPVIDPADIKQKLKQRLAAVDSHVKVVSMTKMHGLAWAVQ